MSDIVKVKVGEEPADPENFVLIQEIQTAEGQLRYCVRAEGMNEDGPISFTETCDSRDIALEWASRLVKAWRSRPPVYMRAALEH